MKTAASILIVLLLIGAGCGSSDTDEPYMPAISFEGSADERNSPVTTQTIKEFKVTAYYRAEYNFVTIMDGVTVTRTGINKWSYSPAVDWPGVPVNFLAVSPASANLQTNYWGPGNQVKDYVCSGKEELLVATRFDALQGAGNIKLNFRHTLSQVLVKLRAEVPEGMKVVVHKAYIRDIAVQGDYTLPTATTSPIVGGDLDGAVRGYWSTWNRSSTSRLIYDAGDNDMELTDVAQPLSNQDVIFFIPTKLDPVEFSGYYHGSRIDVLYRVYDKATGTPLWPSTQTPMEDIDGEERNYAVARFSLADGVRDGEWQQGWSYNYSAVLIPGNISSATRSAASTDVESIASD